MLVRNSCNNPKPTTYKRANTSKESYNLELCLHLPRGDNFASQYTNSNEYIVYCKFQSQLNRRHSFSIKIYHVWRKTRVRHPGVGLCLPLLFTSDAAIIIWGWCLCCSNSIDYLYLNCLLLEFRVAAYKYWSGRLTLNQINSSPVIYHRHHYMPMVYTYELGIHTDAVISGFTLIIDLFIERSNVILITPLTVRSLSRQISMSFW